MLADIFYVPEDPFLKLGASVGGDVATITFREPGPKNPPMRSRESSREPLVVFHLCKAATCVGRSAPLSRRPVECPWLGQGGAGQGLVRPACACAWCNGKDRTIDVYLEGEEPPRRRGSLRRSLPSPSFALSAESWIQETDFG